MVRTSVSSERLDAPAVVETYKRLASVERDFRALKGDDLAVRPIFHWREDRVRAHLFLCFLAAYVRWHLEAGGAPLLFRDEVPPPRTDPVAPPERSASAIAKERDHRKPDGLRVGSFATLMAELATLTRNRVVPAGLGEEAAFEIPSEPTLSRPAPSRSSESHPRACRQSGAASPAAFVLECARRPLEVRASLDREIASRFDELLSEAGSARATRQRETPAPPAAGDDRTDLWPPGWSDWEPDDR